jgi:hypothetical protein
MGVACSTHGNKQLWLEMLKRGEHICRWGITLKLAFEKYV